MKEGKIAMNDDQLDEVTGGTIIPHLVKDGQTLHSIALLYGVTDEQMEEWNGLKKNDILQVGQKLKVKF